MTNSFYAARSGTGIQEMPHPVYKDDTLPGNIYTGDTVCIIDNHHQETLVS